MKHAQEHSNMWAQFAAAALFGRVRMRTSEHAARMAATDADALLAQWLERFPEERPR